MTCRGCTISKSMPFSLSEFWMEAYTALPVDYFDLQTAFAYYMLIILGIIKSFEFNVHNFSYNELFKHFIRAHMHKISYFKQNTNNF